MMREQRFRSDLVSIWMLRAAMILGLFTTVPVFAVEHPGVLPANSDCSSCHAAKLIGKSVHSVMVTTCTVCHVTMTQGDMTLVSLSMPKEKICSACHEQSGALRQHVPGTKGTCVDCHDAHSSDYKMLLRAAAVPHGQPDPSRSLTRP